MSYKFTLTSSAAGVIIDSDVLHGFTIEIVVQFNIYPLKMLCLNLLSGHSIPQLNFVTSFVTFLVTQTCTIYW